MRGHLSNFPRVTKKKKTEEIICADVSLMKVVGNYLKFCVLHEISELPSSHCYCVWVHT